MRYLVLIALLVVIGVGTYIYFNMPPAPAVAGDMAPDFTLEDTEGNKVTLSALRGKVVMVNFWATWCPPCKEEMPSMERLNKIMAGEDFVMLAINADDNGRAVVPDFLENNPHDFRAGALSFSLRTSPSFGSPWQRRTGMRAPSRNRNASYQVQELCPATRWSWE